MGRIIGYKFKRVNGLGKPICEGMPEVKKIKLTDRKIGGVTYRVWSAFTDEINAADSLENLMLNRLESDESEEQSDQEEQEFPTLKMRFSRKNFCGSGKNAGLLQTDVVYCWGKTKRSAAGKGVL